MEEREGTISLNSIPLKEHEAPDSFFLSPRSENLIPFPVPSTMTTAAAAATAAAPVDGRMPGKKKRGRPKKYNADGTLAVTLSPMPISSSVPLSWKRSRGGLLGSLKSSHKFDSLSSGQIALFSSPNFMPHVVTVNAGEDVMMKIMSFSQQGSCAICVLSANGTISNVTLRQPMSSGGSLTFEGCFEIIYLSGSFILTENGGTRSRSGGMSVSLAGPDGRVFGGGLAGVFVAAAPVQVILGSFLVGYGQQQKKLEKQRVVAASSIISTEELRNCYEKFRPIRNPILTNTNTVQDYFTNSGDDSREPSVSLFGEESEGNSQSDRELPNQY